MQFVSRDGKRLRCGYTTGACAAGAAKAAALMLVTGQAIRRIRIDTPKGIALTLDIADARIDDEGARCAVRKDSGDDPDVTNGALVYATVSRSESGIRIDGGHGVGRVTKPGLDQPVGAAAINSTPREMIRNALRQVIDETGYSSGFSVVISVPDGEALAQRTFNPRMGIEGGISIIGTTGIVEPMSHKALEATIQLELSQLRASGARSVLLTPGNYGEDFARGFLGLDMAEHVVCSNYIGSAIDDAAGLGFSEILLVGHIGKLVKLGIGASNTHSSHVDGRMETLCACALNAGADVDLLRGIMGCVSTDAALELIDGAGITDAAMDELGARIESFLDGRVPEDASIGYVMFTGLGASKRELIRSENATHLLNQWRAKS